MTETLAKYSTLPFYKKEVITLQEASVILTAFLDNAEDVIPSDIKSDLDMLVANKHPNSTELLSGEAWLRVVRRVCRKLQQYIENDPKVLETSYSFRYNWNYGVKDFISFLDKR